MCDNTELKDRIIQNIRTILDPDLGSINIYDLGLIYNIDIIDGDVTILMTLTSSGCPSADYLVNDVIFVTKTTPDVKSVQVNLTFDPPWSIDRIDESFKYELGLL